MTVCTGVVEQEKEYVCVCVSHAETSPDLNVNVERFRGLCAAMHNAENALIMPANMDIRTQECCMMTCIIRGFF